MKRLSWIGLLAFAVAAGFGCGDGDSATNGINNPPGSDNALFRVLLTDAPADYIESAVITVNQVYLVADDDDSEPGTGDPNRVDLWAVDAAPQTFDLMTLRDGVTALLAETPVPEDDYHQLRLVVEDAVVTLKEGYEFEGGGRTAPLKTPSAHASGIKVQLAEPIAAEPGMVTILTVDFDVNDNFRIQGNPETPAGIKGMLFTPVLKEKSRESEPDEE